MLEAQELSARLLFRTPRLTRLRKHLAGCAGGHSMANLGWAPPGVNQGGRMRKLRAILHCEKGANAIEYALVASLIAIAAVGAFMNLRDKLGIMYNNVENSI
jgi:pilus assembly protein Flp/PilA